MGSWDNNAWYTSTNSFDWKAVDRIQIVSENMALTGKKFWFDQIRINGTPLTGISENTMNNSFQAKAFPNPFTDETTIEYVLPEASSVNVSIFSLEGTQLATLTDSRQTPGTHQITWTPGQQGISESAEGVYLCKISASNQSTVLKLVKKNK